jgi:hypothetical protein
MATKPIEVKKTKEEKEPKEVKETNEVKKPKKVKVTSVVKKPKKVKETIEVKKVKIKRLAKGLRKHIRRTKQAERKEAVIVNPKN